MSTPDVIDMVKSALRTQGYDGLYNYDGGCACLLDDLAPCGCIEGSCVAGWRVPCDGCDYGSDCEWHVSARASDALAPKEDA